MNLWKIVSTLAFLGLFTIVNVLLVEAVTGRAITVDDDGKADYVNIQDAIENASDDDTILVFEGIYFEQIIVSKSVTLIGNGSDVTIVDGGGKSPIITITGNNTKIDRFQIRNSSEEGIGLQVEGNNVEVSNVTCSEAYYAIYLLESNRTRILNNTFFKNGYGCYLERSSNATLKKNTCIEYEVIGFAIESSDYNLLEENTLLANEGFSEGFSLQNSSFNVLESNTCSNGFSGISLVNYCYRNSLSNNFLSNHSSAISLSDSSNFNILEHNSCSGSSTGIFIGWSRNNFVKNNTIFDNDYGILIYYVSEEEKSSHVLQNNTLLGNTVHIKMKNMDYEINDSFLILAGACCSSAIILIACVFFIQKRSEA